jgi:hypothetical protein
MNPEFDVQVALPDVLTESVHIEVTLADGAPPPIFDELSRVARNFFHLADAGAYVIETAAPEDGRFQILDERREAQHMAWDCRASATDARLAQTFRNVLVMFHQLHYPVARMTMTAPRAPQMHSLPALGSRPLRDTYPGVSTKLRFQVAHRHPQTNRVGRRVQIECTEQIADAALHHVLHLLELWSDVSMTAYARTEDEVWSGECAIFDALPDIMDEYTVELLLETFGAPEVAWHSLLNLCGRIDRDIVRISKVTIQ